MTGDSAVHVSWLMMHMLAVLYVATVKRAGCWRVVRTADTRWVVVPVDLTGFSVGVCVGVDADLSRQHCPSRSGAW